MASGGCRLKPENKSGRDGRPEVQCKAEELALVAEEVLAGSWCVVNFMLASEQGSQILVDVVHISPRGVL